MKKLTLFGLAWPIFIETALYMLLGFVDVYILSGYNDLAASSVGAANQTVSIVTIVFNILSTASAVMISQYLGAGQRQSASQVAALSIVLQFFFGIAVSVVFLLFNQDKLTRTLNQEQADHFIRQAKEAAEQAAKKAAEEARARAAKNNPPPVRKLLIDGGTVEDQMYLPRVENAENLPHLIPGKIPAGTPLWPQTIQAQTSPRP